MNILDEYIPASQRRLLENWRIRPRQIGFNIGRRGLQDGGATTPSECYLTSAESVTAKDGSIPFCLGRRLVEDRLRFPASERSQLATQARTEEPADTPTPVKRINLLRRPTLTLEARPAETPPEWKGARIGCSIAPPRLKPWPRNDREAVPGPARSPFVATRSPCAGRAVPGFAPAQDLEPRPEPAERSLSAS